jgi:hypothetical protein
MVPEVSTHSFEHVFHMVTTARRRVFPRSSAAVEASSAPKRGAGELMAEQAVKRAREAAAAAAAAASSTSETGDPGRAVAAASA